MEKTAVVTGATGGLGYAVTEALIRDGYFVFGSYFSDTEKAKEMEGIFDGKLTMLPSDFRRENEIEQMAKQILKESPKVDVLINCAGISLTEVFQDGETAQWRDLLEINLMGSMILTKALLPSMIANKKGSVLNISSIWGVSGASCEVIYSVSKAGLIGFTKALAKEVAPTNIRVNCLAPGVIDTKMNEWLSEDEQKTLREEIPLGRFALPEEVAETAVFLCGDKASYITGQVISPNGGVCI